ncbi:MAG: 4Fe-4S binding protein [Methanobacteriota archaeon]|nr:MAG: 4Fe-4S binding protein [Euryarchaeota archaeon]
MNHPSKGVFSELAKAYLEGKDSAFLPEILEMALNVSEAELLLALPCSPDDAAKRIGITHDFAFNALEELYKRGFVLRKESAGEIVYALVNDLLDFLLHDKQIFGRLKDENNRSRFLDLCDSMFEKELSLDEKWSRQIVPQVRVIPIEKTISMKWGEVLPLESASAIIDSASTIAQTECTCRVMARNCDNPTDVCILFDDYAKIFIDRGAGRRITKEEAFEILERSERLGLIHHLNNSDSSGMEFMCSCCTCCCIVLRGMVILGKSDICYKSRYLSESNPERCTGCGKCIERCRFDAISLLGDKAVVDDAKCFGCGLCVSICSENAIELVCVKGPEHITDHLIGTPDDTVEDLMIMKKHS